MIKHKKTVCVKPSLREWKVFDGNSLLVFNFHLQLKWSKDDNGEILHFILSFTLFFCHSFYCKFILTDFLAVTSEQNVFVAPQLGFFLAKFIGSGLELC